MTGRRSFIVKDYLLMVVGSLCTAFGITIFNVPAKIVDGGVSGIATMLYHLTGARVAFTTLAISIPLFLLGLLVFGNKYGFKSLLGTLLLSLFIMLFEQTYGLGGILDLSNHTTYLLSALFGGLFCGLGLGLVMRGGANTGGTDILAQVLSHYTPLSQGMALFCIDGLVILSSAFCFGIEAALYGVITAFVSSRMIDKVLLGFGTHREKSVSIISDRIDDIGDEIIHELGHTGTIFMARGLYSGKDKPVLMCVIENQELGRLTRIVHDADKRAFMIVQESYEVLGEGFTSIEEAAWNARNDFTQKR